MTQDRIGRTRLPGPRRRWSARDGHRMPALGSAFGDEQVPRAVPLEEVGRFRILQTRARPSRLGPFENGARLRVDAAALDAAAGGEVDPAVAIVIPREV